MNEGFETYTELHIAYSEDGRVDFVAPSGNAVTLEEGDTVAELLAALEVGPGFGGQQFKPTLMLEDLLGKAVDTE